MRGLLAAVAACFVMGAAGSVNAAINFVKVTGTITGQGAGPEIDPLFHVGDTITLTATWDPIFMAHDAGPDRTRAYLGGVGAYFYPTAGGAISLGEHSVSVIGAGRELYVGDINDLFPFYSRTYATAGGVVDLSFSSPSLTFTGSKLTDFDGISSPSEVSDVPDLWSFGETFQLANGLYGNTYPTQELYGVWDFANAVVSVSGIPEPSVWAIMIVGFGLMP